MEAAVGIVLASYFAARVSSERGLDSRNVYIIGCYIVVGFTLLHLLGTILALLASSDNLAKWVYGNGENVYIVNFRFLAMRRAVNEQNYYHEINKIPGEAHDMFVHSPATTRLHENHKPKSALQAVKRSFTRNQLDNSPLEVLQAPERSALFVRCNCCIDMRAPIPLRPLGSDANASKDEKLRAQYDLAVAEAEEGLQALSNIAESLSPGRQLNTGSGHRHRLCQTCRDFAYNLHRTHPCNDDTHRTLLSAFFRKLYSCSPRRMKTYEHAKSPQDLESSSKQCHFCLIIWHALSPQQQKDLLDSDTKLVDSHVPGDDQLQWKRCIRIAVTGDDYSKPYRMVVHYGGFRRPRTWARVARGHSKDTATNVFEALRVDEEAPPFEMRRPAIPEDASVLFPPRETREHTFHMIQKWLDLAEIKREGPFSWLPSRLLDVTTPESSIVKVVHSTDISENSDRRYIALSHCWGEVKVMTYDHATKDEFQCGMNVSKLAKTFQEAIDLTRGLRVPYLWIDSLCILQGDSTDWEKESTKMCSVYMSAFLTVASVGSWGAMEGLYPTTRTLANSPCLIGKTNRFSIGVQSTGQLVRDLQLSKWRTRGWTMQEELLSCRMVYFGKDVIAVQARNEPGGSMNVPLIIPDRLTDWVKYESLIRSSEHNSAVPDLHRRWWLWVNSFTHRQLTYPDKDRAMAIFGLATYLTQRKDIDGMSTSNYLAGLWKPKLSADLLWLVAIGPTARPTDNDGNVTYRAPSWSWISVDGGISQWSESAGQTSGITIEDVHAIPEASLNSAGEFVAPEPVPRLGRGSYIQLKGKLRPLRWASEGTSYYYHSNGSLDVESSPHMMTNAVLGIMPIASQDKIGPRCYPMTFTDACNDIVGWFVPDTTDVLDDPEPVLHCLQIKLEPEDELQRRDFTAPWVILGTALRPLEDGGPIPAYTRVGYFELEKHSRGFYLPMDATRKDYVHNPLRVTPDIDPSGVFKNEPEQTIRIY